MESDLLREATEKRHKTAQVCIKRAALCLQKAADSQFRDKKMLTRCYENLRQAIDLNHKDPVAQIEMARLLFILEQEDLALRYFNDAQGLAPEHELVVDFAEQVEQVKHLDEDTYRIIEAVELVEKPQPEKDEDYDILYDETQAFIESQTLWYMQNSVGYETTLDLTKLKEQVLFFKDIEACLEIIQHKLNILSQELEVDELQIALKTLEGLFERYRKSVICSRRLLNIKAEIQTVIRVVEQALNTVSRGYKALVLSNIELIYNQCDTLADALEHCEKQGSIAPVEPLYEKLLRYVQALQEKLDD